VILVHNHLSGVDTGCIVVAADSRRAIRSDAGHELNGPALYRVWGGAVLGDGTIVLLNGGTRQLLFFTESGQYLHAAGGEGRGPGEFLQPDWFARGRGDTLFVWDTRQRRLSLFNKEGEFLTLHHVPEQLPTVRGRFADGSFLVIPISLVRIGADGGVKRDPVQYLRYDLQERSTNRLAGGLGEEWVDGDKGAYALPFGKREAAITHGVSLVLGDNASSTLRYYSVQGQLQRVVQWVTRSIPVTDEDKRDYREHYSGDARAEGQRGRGSIFAADRPRFSSIASDRSGWLWVRLFAPAWEPPGDWLVFDERGVLRCRVKMPFRFAVLEIGEDYILGRERDALDEESVVLFNLTRSH